MVIYQKEQTFSTQELKRLFQSVHWESGDYPQKLVYAMQNFDCVWSARENGNLIGLAAAMSDGIMTAYIHYLLVDPCAQKRGIGSALMKHMLEEYKDYLRVLLVADNVDSEKFYVQFGFYLNDNKKPMYLERF